MYELINTQEIPENNEYEQNIIQAFVIDCFKNGTVQKCIDGLSETRKNENEALRLENEARKIENEALKNGTIDYDQYVELQKMREESQKIREENQKNRVIIVAGGLLLLVASLL